jgi:hypothetical protein
MPKSTHEYLERCHAYRSACTEPAVSVYVKIERTAPEPADQLLQPERSRQQIA